MLIHAARVSDISVLINTCALTDRMLSNLYPNSVQQLPPNAVVIVGQENVKISA